MANMVLDKGFIADPAGFAATSAAVVAWRAVVKSATGAQYCQLATSATAGAANQPLGVVMEAVDATKLATGKVAVDVRMQGIAPITAGVVTGIVVGAKVMTDTQGRAILATSTSQAIGIALQVPTTTGDIINVELTPGLIA